MKLTVSISDLQMMQMLLKFQSGEVALEEIQQLAKMQGRNCWDSKDIVPMLSTYLADRIRVNDLQATIG